MIAVLVFLAAALWGGASAFAAAPATFEEAKQAAREYVYFDQNRGEGVGTLYCGCHWAWMGRSGGRADHASCGYRTRTQVNRAARIEWEHIVPAHSLGQQRQCWQRGGREFCVKDDPVFRVMEADMHNLAPSVGEINADRSNFRFGVVAGEPREYGACDFEVSFKDRVAEPPETVRGMIARVYFYMHDRYDLRMSDVQERLLMTWNDAYPVSEWERERDRRIAAVMGHSNPFVTGERQWTRSHKNHAEGLVMPIPAGHPALRPTGRPGEPGPQSDARTSAPIIGNRNSMIYHLPQGCPSYSQVSPRNQVSFDAEQQAVEAGFRRARNCR